MSTSANPGREPEFNFSKTEVGFDDFSYECNLIIPDGVIEDESHFYRVCRWLEDHGSRISRKVNIHYWNIWRIEFSTQNSDLIKVLSKRCRTTKGIRNNEPYIEDYYYSETNDYQESIYKDLVQESSSYSESYVKSENDGWFYAEEEIIDPVKEAFQNY